MMPSVAETLASLRDTESQIARLEGQIAETPEFESLQFDLMSLQKRQIELRLQFEQLAHNVQTDICDYLIIPEIPDSYPVSAIGQCLQRFQDLFSIVFDSIKTGPKTRARISADVLEQSSFNFGYAYAGSLGFTFTVPGERLLGIESDVDRAASLFLSLLKCETSDAIRELVPQVGIAAISRTYELSRVHGGYALNTRVRWRRGKELTHDVTVHAPEFERLRAIIDETGDEETESVTLTGRLAGLDVDTDYFHLTFPEADEIKGKLAENFSQVEGVAVPGVYRADLVKTTRLHYSTGLADVGWTLVSLSPLRQEIANKLTDMP